MHECPECGQACACDQEDTWLDSESESCEHQCEPGDLDEDDDPGDSDDEEDLGQVCVTCGPCMAPWLQRW